MMFRNIDIQFGKITRIVSSTKSIRVGGRLDHVCLLKDRGIEWRKSGSGEWTRISADSDEPAATVQGLSQGTEYEFRLFAVRQDDVEAFGKILKLKTLGACQKTSQKSRRES